MTQTPPLMPKDPYLLPCLGSVVVHIALIFLLFLWTDEKPIPSVSGMQADLVSADELAQIEGQMRANAALRQQQGNSHAQPSPQSTQTTPTISPQMQAYNDSLAQKEAAYRKQMEQFAAQLEAETQADMAAFEQALLEAEKQREKDVQDLRQTAARQGEREEANQKALAAAKEKNDKRNAELEKQRLASGQSGSMSDGTSYGDNASREHGGTQATKTTASAGGGDDSIKAALISHIRPHWHYVTPDTKYTLIAKISVDSAGNVISSSISGGTPELRASLKTAIMKASPLTPVVGTNYTTLNIQFITNQK